MNRSKNIFDIKGISASTLANLLDIANPIIILPFILIYFSPDQLGFWYLITSLNIIVRFSENVINSVIVRNCIYYLERYVGEENNFLFKSVLEKIKLEIVQKTYFKLLIFSALLYLTVTFLYLFFIIDQLKLYLIWGVFALSNLVLIYSTKFKSIVLLHGKLSKIYYPEIISKSIYILLAILFFSIDLNLLGLIIAYLISSLIHILIFKRIGDKLHFKNYDNEINCSRLIQLIEKKNIKEFIKQSQIEGSNLLSVRAGTLIVGYYFSLASAGIYGLTSNIFSIIHRMSMIIVTYFYPFYIKLNSQMKLNKFKKWYRINFFAALLFSIFSGLVVLFFGTDIIKFISSDSEISNTTIVSLFLISCTLSVLIDHLIIHLFIKKDFSLTKHLVLNYLISIFFQLILVNMFGEKGILIAMISVPLLFLFWKLLYYQQKKYNLFFK